MWYVLYELKKHTKTWIMIGDVGKTEIGKKGYVSWRLAEEV